LIPGQEAVRTPSDQKEVAQGDNLKIRERFSSPRAVRRGEPEVEGTQQISVNKLGEKETLEGYWYIFFKPIYVYYLQIIYFIDILCCPLYLPN
jgi:hypothetical protein